MGAVEENLNGLGLRLNHLGLPHASGPAPQSQTGGPHRRCRWCRDLHPSEVASDAKRGALVVVVPSTWARRGRESGNESGEPVVAGTSRL
jgi:hypothetical protein